MSKYDVFISFKYTDQGSITSDSHVAEQLYFALNEAGFRVFYSESELHLTGESEYMSAIDNALKESWIFIVVASKPEYVNSGWVAQEWRSFVNMAMKDSKRKIYSFLIGDMTVEDLPALLGPYQSFSMNDGINGIVRYIEHATKPSAEQIKQIDSDPVKRIVRLGFGIGQRRDFNLACEYIEESKIDHPLLNAMLVKRNFDNMKNSEDTNRLVQKLCMSKSVAGPYWTSRAYRHGKFGLEISIRDYKRALSEAKDNWNRLVHKSNRANNEEKQLLICTYSEDDQLLNAAEYMCACIYEILEVMDINCKIIEASPNKYPDQVNLNDYLFVLYASSSVSAFNYDTVEKSEWLDKLRKMPIEKMYIGLAGVRMANINKKFRNRHFILNREAEIGNYCTHLVNCLQGER